MKWVCVLLLLIVALLVWDGRALAMVRFMGNAHRPSLDSDFQLLEELLPARPVLAEMHAGLPHPYHEKDEFFHELWDGGNLSIHGYRFYRQPEKSSPAVAATFADVLSDRRSFTPYAGPKMCGGYHADFAVRLESRGESTWFLVCLGCGEVLIYSKDRELICDLEPVAETRLREAWSEQLGEPFKLVRTHLPVPRDELEKWGYTEYRRSHSDRPPGKKPRVLPGNVRGQTIFSGGTEPDAQSPLVVFVLREESFATEEEAADRLAELNEPAGNAATNRDGTVHVCRNFAIGTCVYAISTKPMGQAAPIQSMLDLFRRHIETTPPREVKQFE
jgi:hypothetical protein